jgi:hypothetical protein
MGNIATCYGSDGDSKTEANAHLIAAAPAMYKALKVTVKILNTMTTEDFSLGRDSSVRAQIAEAIDKAEGK